MRVLYNAKIIETDSIRRQAAEFQTVRIDVGTGSGRYIYKAALRDKDCFCIGMDPVANAMRETAAKAHKRKLANALFAVAAIETVPDDLAGLADNVTVILPWGSLRDGIVQTSPVVLDGLRKLGKAGSELVVILGYDEGRDGCDITQRDLPKLSAEHFHSLAPLYQKFGLVLTGAAGLQNADIKALESDWAKRLAFGAARNFYRLTFQHE